MTEIKTRNRTEDNRTLDELFADETFYSFENDFFMMGFIMDFKRIPDHEHSQCYIVTHDAESFQTGNPALIMDLISYTTKVATAVYNYKTKEIHIACYDLHSRTTRKHIGYFAKYLSNKYDCNLTYYDFKDIVGMPYGRE